MSSEPHDLASAIGLSIADPGFYPAVFAQVAHQGRSEQSPRERLKQILLEDYLELSEKLDRAQIQDSCSVRNVLRTRALAILLVNDQGELQQALLPVAAEILLKNLYSLGPHRGADAARQHHLLKVIQRLHQDKELRALLKLISKPQGHRLIEQVIRDTLQLAPDSPLTDADARRAALAAWLCYLRQNVGSCFATAPAIIIHDEQPHLLLKDLSGLLATGRLQKVYGGVEYSVPFSPTWGAGDLRKPFALFASQEGERAPICQSPGLLQAVKSVGLPEESLALACQELVGHAPYVVSSPETLIRYLLLNHHAVTNQDILDYENRPKPLMQSGLLAYTPQTKGEGKGARCARFLIDFERACSVFKSLTDNALLRSWEFTLASFSEIKSDFARWNLYSSLGFRPEEPGGIGAQLYAIVQEKLNRANAQVHSYQDEYEQIFGQVKYLEGRLRSASTEEEIRWLRADYQTKVNEFRTFEEIREKALAKAKRYANLFSALIDLYLQLFPNYFQEIYDADLHDVDVGPYDDSPAGFRLLFKHGRTNTSLWTLIKNQTQFIEALSSFFVLSESQVASAPEVEGLEQDLAEIITAIVNHIKSENFLISALYRMAQAHHVRLIKDPLQNIDKIEKKPWAYTSGGTMDTLVSCYYRREDKPTEMSRWVENEVELLVFLMDCVKRIPHKESDPYLDNPGKSLLTHSPTHAFLLKPAFELFREGIRDNTYTYIWVRDQIVNPMKRFVDSQYVDREMIQLLIERLEEQVPPSFRANFRTVFSTLPGKMKAVEFRSYVMNELGKYRALQWHGMPILNEEQVDALLYRSLPFTHGYQTRQRIGKLLEELPELSSQTVQTLLKMFDKLMPASLATRALPADRLQDIAKSLLCLEFRQPHISSDYHLRIAQAAQKLGFAMPQPLLFADTNWVTDYFGFLVSPGSGQFELWRLDYSGSFGAPMSNWKQWVDGSHRDRTWGVYVRPDQYQA